MCDTYEDGQCDRCCTSGMWTDLSLYEVGGEKVLLCEACADEIPGEG
jgi:hypothetical protein